MKDLPGFLAIICENQQDNLSRFFNSLFLRKKETGTLCPFQTSGRGVHRNKIQE